MAWCRRRQSDQLITSEDVTQDRLHIRSYIDTARKCSINAMTALRGALAGRPWQPPLAAAASP